MFKVMDGLQAATDLIIAENLIAGELDRTDFVLPPFVNVKLNRQPAHRRMLKFYILDLKIKIAVVAIKLDELVAVVIEIILLENAAARQPRKHPALFCFDLLAQLLLRKRRRADKLNLRDFDFWSFDDLKCDR